MNVSLKVFWSNQPIPVQQKIEQPDIMLNIPFGNVLVIGSGGQSPVLSVNNKTGHIALNAIDVGADTVGSARNVFDELSPKVDALIDNKLDKVDYVQHFRGLFSSYTALNAALPMASNGDYAHIDSGTGFDRMCAIWDSDDEAWKIIETNMALNSDEMPEGASNLYFKSERVRSTALLGLSIPAPNPIAETDNLLEAIAKLQAQINTIKPPQWIPATDVLNAMPTGITPYVTIKGKQAKLEFLKANGMLYIRGGFTVTEVISQMTLGTLKAGYKVKFAVDPLVIVQYVNLIKAFSTVAGSVYIKSDPIDKLIDEHLVNQEFKTTMTLGLGNYHTFGCLGAVLD